MDLMDNGHLLSMFVMTGSAFGWLQNKEERLKGLSQRLLWSSSGCVFWHPWGPSSALQAVSVCPSSLGPASTPMGRCATSPPIRHEHTRPSANQSPRSVCGPRGTGGTRGLPLGPAPTRGSSEGSLRRDAVPGVLTSPLGPAPLIPKTTTPARGRGPITASSSSSQATGCTKSKSKGPTSLIVKGPPPPPVSVSGSARPAAS